MTRPVPSGQLQVPPNIAVTLDWHHPESHDPISKPRFNGSYATCHDLMSPKETGAKRKGKKRGKKGKKRKKRKKNRCWKYSVKYSNRLPTSLAVMAFSPKAVQSGRTSYPNPTELPGSSIWTALFPRDQLREAKDPILLTNRAIERLGVP